MRDNQTPMNTSPQLRSNASVHLDAIRGAAALVVFFGHGRPLFVSSRLVARSAPSAGTEAPRAGALPRTTLGHEAVIIFFVLSGYFVGGSVIRNVRRGTFAWTRYLLDRLSRLWVVLIPALLLGLALDRGGMHLWGALPGSLYTSPAGSLVFPGLSARVGLSTLLGNIFFLQFSGVEPFGTNVALWSLACEFWYYLFFPLLLFALLRTRSLASRLTSILLCLLLLVACGKGVAIYFPLWLAGCLVAVLPTRMLRWQQRPAVAALGMLLLAICACCLKYSVPSYVADLAIALVFSVLLWVILQNPRTSLSPVYAFCAKSMAKMSYTLYAVHVPLLIFFCALLSPIWHPQRLSFPLLRELVAVYFVTFVIATLMYLLFERNTRLLRSWLSATIEAPRADSSALSSSVAPRIRSTR